MKPSASPTQVVFVGDGGLATAWRALVDESPRMEWVASAAPGRDLAWALDEFPDARVAAALGPRGAADIAAQLAQCSRRGVVSAPLHVKVAEHGLSSAAEDVQVDYGWCTLRGAARLAQLFRDGIAYRATVRYGGCPMTRDADPQSELAHAVALAVGWLPPAPTVSVDKHRIRLATHDGEMAVELVSQSDWGVEAECKLRDGGAIRWQYRRGIDKLGAPGSEQSLQVHEAERRGLHQLLAPEATGGHNLRTATQVARCVSEILAYRPQIALPGGESLARARHKPAGELAGIGLHAAQVPPNFAELPDVVDVDVPGRVFELWAFRAGIKPVTFLTVEPDRADATIAAFAAVVAPDELVAVRRDRRVAVSAQDTWDDDRREGKRRAELYLSTDRARAERAAVLQADGDPTASMKELGGLLGYPGCCVQAFARQAQRANNTANRYACATRTDAPPPWPGLLNDLFLKVVPFYPCRYDCAAALAWAQATLAAMARFHPEAARDIRALLSSSVLYFDHDHQLLLLPPDGQGSPTKRTRDNVAYHLVKFAVAPPDASGEFANLARTIAAGDSLTWDETALQVFRGGKPFAKWLRVDPGLGMLAQFGPG